MVRISIQQLLPFFIVCSGLKPTASGAEESKKKIMRRLFFATRDMLLRLGGKLFRGPNRPRGMVSLLRPRWDEAQRKWETIADMLYGVTYLSRPHSLSHPLSKNPSDTLGDDVVVNTRMFLNFTPLRLLISINVFSRNPLYKKTHRHLNGKSPEEIACIRFCEFVFCWALRGFVGKDRTWELCFLQCQSMLAYWCTPTRHNSKENKFVWSAYLVLSMILGLHKLYRDNHRRHHLRVILRAFPPGVQRAFLEKDLCHNRFWRAYLQFFFA